MPRTRQLSRQRLAPSAPRLPLWRRERLIHYYPQGSESLSTKGATSFRTFSGPGYSSAVVDTDLQRIAALGMTMVRVVLFDSSDQANSGSVYAGLVYFSPTTLDTTGFGNLKDFMTRAHKYGLGVYLWYSAAPYTDATLAQYESFFGTLQQYLPDPHPLRVIELLDEQSGAVPASYQSYLTGLLPWLRARFPGVTITASVQGYGASGQGSGNVPYLLQALGGGALPYLGVHRNDNLTWQDAPQGALAEQVAAAAANLLTVTTSSTAVTAGTTTSITLASASGFSAGQAVLIDPGTNQEYAVIQSISTTTLTFPAALQHAHSGSYEVIALGSAAGPGPVVPTWVDQAGGTTDPGAVTNLSYVPTVHPDAAEAQQEYYARTLFLRLRDLGLGYPGWWELHDRAHVLSPLGPPAAQTLSYSTDADPGFTARLSGTVYVAISYTSGGVEGYATVIGAAMGTNNTIIVPAFTCPRYVQYVNYYCGVSAALTDLKLVAQQYVAGQSQAGTVYPQTQAQKITYVGDGRLPQLVYSNATGGSLLCNATHYVLYRWLTANGATAPAFISIKTGGTSGSTAQLIMEALPVPAQATGLAVYMSQAGSGNNLYSYGLTAVQTWATPGAGPSGNGLTTQVTLNTYTALAVGQAGPGSTTVPFAAPYAGTATQSTTAGSLSASKTHTWSYAWQDTSGNWVAAAPLTITLDATHTAFATPALIPPPNTAGFALYVETADGSTAYRSYAVWTASTPTTYSALLSGGLVPAQTVTGYGSGTDTHAPAILPYPNTTSGYPENIYYGSGGTGVAAGQYVGEFPDDHSWGLYRAVEAGGSLAAANATLKPAGTTLQNLLTGKGALSLDWNSSFDESVSGPDGNTYAKYWELLGANAGNGTPYAYLGLIYRDTTTVHAGGSTASLRFHNIGGSGTNTIYAAIPVLLQPVPGKTYTVSCWINIAAMAASYGGNAAQAALVALIMDAGGATLASGSATQAAATAGWVQLSCTVTWPQTRLAYLMVYVGVQCANPTAQWDVYFDDVTLS